jgi:hypothetical protein
MHFHKVTAIVNHSFDLNTARAILIFWQHNKELPLIGELVCFRLRLIFMKNGNLLVGR